jgi:hypothetical protein
LLFSFSILFFHLHWFPFPSALIALISLPISPNCAQQLH